MHPSSTKITLGIPTRGRPATVARCLQSFVDNAEAYGRDAVFFVVDDNVEQQLAEETRARVAATTQSTQTSIRYLNREARLQMANTLAKKANLPVELLTYALLGDERCPSAYGAARNTLLLATAGTLHVQVDDDTICNLHSTAAGSQDLAPSTSLPADHYQFFQTRNEALAVAQGANVELLGLYEAYLGKPVAALTKAANFAEDIRVVSVCLGAAGDSGMSTTMGRLSFEGASRDALLADADAYRWKLFTRNIIRAPEGPRIGTGRSLITINLGLDNRTILPPFPPNMRNEDSVFGEILGLSQPNGCRIHVPFTLQHDPPDHREPDAGISVPGVNVNKVLAATLSSFGPGIPSVDPTVNIPLLGTYLQQLSQVPLDEFVQYTTNATRRVYEETLKSIEAATADLSVYPDFYQDDVNAFKLCLAHAIEDEETFMPTDLDGAPQEVWEFAQVLFGRYARLLKHWPAIVAAARQLR